MSPYSYSAVLGGDDGIRTHDPLLAGQVLSQLSYTPVVVFRFTSTGIRTHDRVSRWRIRQDSRALAGCPSRTHSLDASAVLIPTELHPRLQSFALVNRDLTLDRLLLSGDHLFLQ